MVKEVIYQIVPAWVFFGRGSKFLIINACRIILIFKVRIAIHLINIFMEETPYTSVNQCGKIPTTLI